MTNRGRPRLPRWPEIPTRYHKPRSLTGTERQIFEGLKASRRKREEPANHAPDVQRPRVNGASHTPHQKGEERR